MSPATPLRGELLASLGIIFGGVTLLLGIAISLVLPILRSPGEATAFILLVVGIDLVIVLAFGGWVIKKNLLEPVDSLYAGSSRSPTAIIVTASSCLTVSNSEPLARA
jgi:hypothetical protein